MAIDILPSPEEMRQYVKELEPYETSFQRKLRNESAKLDIDACCVDPDQAAVLAILIQPSKSRQVLEIGTTTGYNALRIAQTLFRSTHAEPFTGNINRI